MFHYQTVEELRQAAQEEGVTLPLGGDLSPLGQELEVQGVKLPNRVAIQPMEGCDGTADGKPGELTLRRYDKFARSGAGLLWEEATAVWEEARANPRQLWINEENVGAFQAMNQRIRELSQKENGFAPVIIMQATHSGRYSKPQGVPAPLIAYNNPLFEKDSPIPQERIVSDDYLHRLVERMGEAARLAQRAGFDGIDLKSCHRYLGSELLSAYNRPGDFGGSFENRTRFLRESVQAAKAAVTGDFLITSRLNVYDGFPYPYGFGVSTKGGLEPDLTEPLKLVGILHQELGLGLLDGSLPFFLPGLSGQGQRGPRPRRAQRSRRYVFHRFCHGKPSFLCWFVFTPPAYHAGPGAAMHKNGPVNKNCSSGPICKALFFLKVADGVVDAALHGQRDAAGQRPVVVLHPAPDPVQHLPHKAVFVKPRDKVFFLFGQAGAGAFFVHHPADQPIRHTEQKVLHLFPADAPVGVQDKGFVLQHRLEDLHQPLMPGIIGLFALQGRGGVFHAGPLDQIVNILKMVVKGHPADAAVVGDVPYGDLIQRLFQHQIGRAHV